ncbi:MAG: glycerate kinase [Betaproteobacteria bacterium]|nr:glycerate kinase [Betaproteobacteria bacterium]
MNVRELLIGSFKAALNAADPLQIVPKHLPDPSTFAGGKLLVIGAGKAAASMAKAVEDSYPDAVPVTGVVITRYGHGLPLRRIRVVEAGHPVPDAQGEAAAREIHDSVAALGPNDLVLALISGGGSSLLSLPVDGVTMADLKDVTRELLRCGAPIQKMNTVRKHLSRIQGGRLAALTRARIVSLIISDVTGDDPTHIASGPTAADPSTFQDALDIINYHGVTPPLSVARYLSRGARGEVPESPKPGDAAFRRVDNRVIATAHASLAMAAAYVQQRGVAPMILGDSVTGESAEVAKVYAALARQIQQYHHPIKPPVALISGGETTVTLRQPAERNQLPGRGGRCSEFLLSLGIELAGTSGVHALACDTDGIDGSEENAGALLFPDALVRAAAKGLDGSKCLARNDAFTFFHALDDLVVTGPTRTNVNDYRIILVQ